MENCSGRSTLDLSAGGISRIAPSIAPLSGNKLRREEDMATKAKARLLHSTISASERVSGLGVKGALPPVRFECGIVCGGTPGTQNMELL